MTDKLIKAISKDGFVEKILTSNEYFEVREYKIQNEASFKREKPYLLETVVEGSGEITIESKSYPIKKGDFFIITNKATDYKFKGRITIVESNAVEEKWKKE